MIRKRLGELAIDKNWLTNHELEILLSLQQQLRESGAQRQETLFGKLLIDQGVCSKTMVQDLLSLQNTSTEFLFYSLKSGGNPFSFGNYTVEKLIGKGGMGDVYKAKRSDNTYVALKTINWKNYNHTLKKRFLREISTLIELKHSNIVAVYDHGQINGIDFLVMQYLDGITLDQAIKDKTFSYKQWLNKFLSLLYAIELTHGQNIIHRDLKPTNIIFTAEENLVLIDFGLSRNVSQDYYTTLLTTHPIGTPTYMAPEQFDFEEEADCRTDIWSLGIVLYQILTNKLPFYDKNMQKLICAIQTSPPKSLQQHIPDLPKDLNIICQRALEKNCDNRYQSVTEMASDINNFLQGKSIPQRQSIVTVVSEKWHIGDIIENKYKLIELLGQGGMGTIYKVEDLSTHKPLALKILHSYLWQNEHFRRHFLEKAPIAKQFFHPHALPIQDFGEMEDHLFFTMDFSQGCCLKTLLTGKNVLTEDRAVIIISQVLQALDTYHQQSLIHLNLKPSNIIVEERNGKDHALVLDIGIHKIPLNPDSVYYTSPEQVGGDEEISQQTDIYSLGVILYEMVTGRLPFERGTQLEVFTYGHLSAKEANENVSQKISDIIDQALEKNREQRFTYAQDFLLSLQNLSGK